MSRRGIVLWVLLVVALAGGLWWGQSRPSHRVRGPEGPSELHVSTEP